MDFYQGKFYSILSLENGVSLGFIFSFNGRREAYVSGVMFQNDLVRNKGSLKVCGDHHSFCG